MSIRKVHSNGRTIVGYVHSGKNKKPIQFESLLEREFLYLLEYDSAVIEIADQPFSINYPSRGDKRFYTPDFLASYRDGKQVVFEVKYSHDLETNSRKYAAKFKAAKIFAKSKGYIFRTITEKEIRTTYKENVKRLLIFQGVSADLSAQHAILNCLRNSSPKSFLDLVKIITDSPEEQQTYIRPFWVLLCQKIITADLFMPLTLKSPAWICDSKFAPVQLGYPYVKNPKVKTPKYAIQD